MTDKVGLVVFFSPFQIKTSGYFNSIYFLLSVN